MIVRTIADLEAQGSYREKPGVWSSARYLLRNDGMGLTVTETNISAGSTQVMQYKNHLEANLVIAGSGTVTDLGSGTVHALEPGTLYALDKHDHHRIDATTDMRMVCVFTPALVGGETHDEQGSYPILEDD